MALIAREAKLPFDAIEAQGPYDLNLPLVEQEPTAEQRSSQIIGEGALYRLRFENNPVLPIISVFAQAPTTGEAIEPGRGRAEGAARLHRAASRPGSTPRTTGASRSASSGTATGGVVNEGANIQIAALVFIAVLIGWCMLLIPAQTIARGWREIDIEEGAADRGPGDGSNGNGLRTRSAARSSSTRSAEVEAGASSAATGWSSGDAWPRTRRPLPWLFAGFLAMIFLVPFDAIHLKVPLPFSSDFDRFFVAVIVAVWVARGVFGGNRGRGTPAPARLGGGDDRLLVRRGRQHRRQRRAGSPTSANGTSPQKQLAVLFGLVAVFAIVTLTLRAAELRPFSVLIVVLAVITALGTIFEKKTGYNVFYATATAALSPMAAVDPAPTDVAPNPNESRPMIAGPDPARALGHLDPRHGAALRRGARRDRHRRCEDACSGASPRA